MTVDKLTAKDNAQRRAKHLAKMKADAARNALNDPTWLPRLRELEAELLRAKPHLRNQKRRGLADAMDAPRRRVVCPNGVVLHASWYKVPTTDADSRKALAETKWFNEQGLLQRRGLPNAYPFPLGAAS